MIQARITYNGNNPLTNRDTYKQFVSDFDDNSFGASIVDNLKSKIQEQWRIPIGCQHLRVIMNVAVEQISPPVYFSPCRISSRFEPIDISLERTTPDSFSLVVVGFLKPPAASTSSTHKQQIKPGNGN